METTGWLAVALLGVALSALYSGLETGCYCVNRIRLAARVSGAPAWAPARVLWREMQRLDRALATLLIGNNIANYLGALGVAALLTSAGFSDWEVVGVNALVLTPLLFVFGETIPKDLFRAQADRLAPAFAWALTLTRWAATAALLLPIVRFTGALVARGSARAAAPAARARIAALVKEGARHGVFVESQMRLIDDALALRDLRVRDEMIPWRSAVCMGVDWSRERVERALRAARFSRFPVVDRRGRVLGQIEAFDVWLNPDASVASLMREVHRLEADLPLRDAIHRVRAAGDDLCVVERRGRPVGVATRKDLAEPVVGELHAW